MGALRQQEKKDLTLISQREQKLLDNIFFSSRVLMKGYNVFKKFAIDTEIPENKLKFYYDNQELTQMFRPLPKRNDISYVEISADYPFERLYIDTMFFPTINITLINALDLFSKYGFSKAFRGSSVSSSKAVEALDEFVMEIAGLDYYPTSLWVDAGSEFKDKLKKECDDIGIVVKYTDPKDKNQNSPIEAFNRTIRLSLEKVLAVIGKNAPVTSQAQKSIKDIIKSYNNTPHSRTKYTPNEILKSKKIQDEVREATAMRQSIQIKQRQELKEGTSVRIVEKRQVFGKLTPNWTKKLYVVKSFDRGRNRYKLEGMPKYYSRQDLMPVDTENLMSHTIRRYEEARATPDDKRPSRSEARARKELETKAKYGELTSEKRERKDRVIMDL